MPYVGIMGGTFDPIHYGHLAAAEGAMHLTGLEQVIFLPNRQPPHKVGRTVSPAVHRAAMVKAAIAGNPRFGFSDMELLREGPSFTIDTVRAVQASHPEWRTAFIIGMDSLLEIETWRDYRTLLTLTDIVAVGRPGFSNAQRDDALAGLGPELTRRIRLIETPGVAVSSTELRRMAAAGYPLRYLVPDAVERYVGEQRVYG